MRFRVGDLVTWNGKAWAITAILEDYQHVDLEDAEGKEALGIDSEELRFVEP